jgi:ABC-type Fe3+ transport system permease subunit
MMADVPASPAVRRGWRGWAWGWIALGAAIAVWCGVFLQVLLMFASVGSPGDGDNALRSVMPMLLVTLSLTGTAALACVIASVLAVRLRRQPAGGGVALALLALLLVVLLIPSLVSRQAIVADVLPAATPIWQVTGVQG